MNDRLMQSDCCFLTAEWIRSARKDTMFRAGRGEIRSREECHWCVWGAWRFSDSDRPLHVRKRFENPGSRPKSVSPRVHVLMTCRHWIVRDPRPNLSMGPIRSPTRGCNYCRGNSLIFRVSNPMRAVRCYDSGYRSHSGVPTRPPRRVRAEHRGTRQQAGWRCIAFASLNYRRSESG